MLGAWYGKVVMDGKDANKREMPKSFIIFLSIINIFTSPHLIDYCHS